MNYILEDSGEAKRLERQARQSAYSVEEELPDLAADGRVLDAGCGTGVVARHACRHLRGRNMSIDACDRSEQRLEQARALSSEHPFDRISYFAGDVTHLPCENEYYDLVLNRFVLEHLVAPRAAVREFYRVLKPGGEVRIIDADGVLFNLFTTDERLNGYLDVLRRDLTIDMFVGRKIPNMLVKAGFEEVSWRIDVMRFSGDSLVEEKANYAQRFEFARPVIENILGSEAATFTTSYLRELDRPGNVLFYNKFIVRGLKPDGAGGSETGGGD